MKMETKAKTGRFILAYSNLESKGLITHYHFKKHKDLINFIDDKTFGRKDLNIVYVLKRVGFSGMFISQSAVSIQVFLSKQPCWNTIGNYILSECHNYEEVGDFLLDMDALWKATV